MTLIGKPYDAAEQGVRHALAAIDREYLAEAALSYGYRIAQDGADLSFVRSGILGIDNNFRYKRGPRKGQHRDGVAVVLRTDRSIDLESI